MQRLLEHCCKIKLVPVTSNRIRFTTSQHFEKATDLMRGGPWLLHYHQPI
jgi:hypothetical protein